MTRLIDANALADKVDKYIYRITRASKRKLKVGESAILADIKAYIEVSPTIDAVPLSAVRKAAKKLAYIHQQIDLYGDRPDLHEEEYWLEYLMDEEWKDEEID